MSKTADPEHDAKVVQLNEQQRTRAAVERMIRPLKTDDLYPPLAHAVKEVEKASGKVAKHLSKDDARRGE